MEFGNGFQAQGAAEFWQGIIMAIVLPTDPQARVSMRLTARAVVNRGVNAQLFDNLDDALRWLAAEYSLQTGKLRVQPQ